MKSFSLGRLLLVVACFAFACHCWNWLPAAIAMNNIAVIVLLVTVGITAGAGLGGFLVEDLSRGMAIGAFLGPLLFVTCYWMFGR